MHDMNHSTCEINILLLENIWVEKRHIILVTGLFRKDLDYIHKKINNQCRVVI